MGFKTEQFVEEVIENLTCRWICMEVLEDPHQCNNGHSFCKDCITQCLETRQMCPVCRIPLRVSNLSRCLEMKNMINDLEVYCHPPESDGQREDAEESEIKCDWTGMLQTLAKHREACPFQQVQCPNLNCNTNMQRRELEDHDKICEDKILQCDEQCGVTLIRRDLPNHKTSDCPEVSLSCPNECGESIKRKDIPAHRETCPLQQVQCPNVDCNTNMQRIELEDHDEICEYKEVECDQCRNVLLRFELAVHKNIYCPEQLVACPNNCASPKTGQVNKTKRVDLDDHLINDCPKTILDCPFKDQGCSVQVERQHVEKHVQDNMAAHMMLLAKENKQLKEELNNVKKNEELSRTYIWKIKNFREVKRSHQSSSIRSPTFWLCGYSWYLKMYVNDKLSVRVDLYLDKRCGSRDPTVTLARNADIPVTIRLRVTSQRSGTEDLSTEEHHVYNSSDIFLRKLNWELFRGADDEAYCDKDGHLIIKCTIQVDHERTHVEYRPLWQKFKHSMGI